MLIDSSGRLPLLFFSHRPSHKAICLGALFMIADGISASLRAEVSDEFIDIRPIKSSFAGIYHLLAVVTGIFAPMLFLDPPRNARATAGLLPFVTLCPFQCLGDCEPTHAYHSVFQKVSSGGDCRHY